MNAAGSEDIALLNACLSVEAAIREEEFAAVERLLAHLQFEEGELDERVLALPTRAFARAALDLDALGWITPKEVTGEKTDVGAHLYIEDAPHNVDALRTVAPTIVFTNSTNRALEGLRADDWGEAERLVVQQMAEWKSNRAAE